MYIFNILYIYYFNFSLKSVNISICYIQFCIVCLPIISHYFPNNPLIYHSDIDVSFTVYQQRSLFHHPSPLMIMLPLLHLFHLTFILLSLPQTASSTLLFYVPDSPSAPELTATIDYGITQFSRRLWYNLDHRVLAGGDGQSLVRSLVGNLENVTAFMGVFSDEELNSITPLVDAFGIPTFVLNQVTNFPTSPNIFLTTPSVEFEMKSLEGVLDYYKWDMISYFVEADSSVTDMLKGHGSCWDKHILDPSLIPKQTCKDFSVVILVGYSLFQNSFISHFTASGCRNMVVLQYYLEDSPSMVTADVRNSTEIGDLVMLFPKSYPIINTGVAPSENAKYSCLSPR